MTCEACQREEVPIDPDYMDIFRVAVCLGCKDTNPLYTLITKTQARNEFLLTDEELADTSLMPSLSRKNPHNPRWSDMKLYLRRQCRDFAWKKFNGESGLEAALEARSGAKSERKSKQFLKKLKELRSKTRVEKRVQLTPAGSKSHAHKFESGKCIVCGLQVEQEEL